MADLDTLLAEATGFEWDSGNEAKNWVKHSVSRAECEQVFQNKPRVLPADPVRSRGELRGYVLGRTDDERPLFIVFTLRGPLIRVISARPMNRVERQVYIDAKNEEESI